MSLIEVLDKAAADEENPKTDLERFFVVLKGMTIYGYYTSEVGIASGSGIHRQHLLGAPPSAPILNTRDDVAISQRRGSG